MEEFIQPLWWFAGMLICTAIFELLNGAFKQELNKLFKGWDSSLHEIISNEHSIELYWDLVDFIKELMKKSLNIFTFFSAVIVIMAFLFRSNTSAAILSFCLGIITYRFAIFNNWLGMKKYGEDNRHKKYGQDNGHEKDADNNGE
jgi:small-conductance mechanosensitive channel